MKKRSKLDIIRMKIDANFYYIILIISYRLAGMPRRCPGLTELSEQYFIKTYVDGLKVGEIKISARGPQIGPNVHHTDEKLKDQKKTNRQIDRIRKYKKEEMFIRMNKSRSHSESATR
jgi:hypothetical protein